MEETLNRLSLEEERAEFSEWLACEIPFDMNVGMAEHAIKTGAAWQAWTARAALEDLRCNEVVQQERQSLAMMLRMCASRLRNHGHQDLGDKAVDLLIRFGLQGSPLRAEPQKLPILPPSTELEKLAEEAGMVNLLNNGAASCVHSEGCHGVTQEHLERFAELVRKHKPLTLEQIAALEAGCSHQSVDWDTRVSLVRSVERAHGIGA